MTFLLVPFAVVGTDKAPGISPASPFGHSDGKTGVGGGMLLATYFWRYPRISPAKQLTRFAQLLVPPPTLSLVSYAGVTKIWAAVVCVVLLLALGAGRSNNVLSPTLRLTSCAKSTSFSSQTQKPGKQPEQNTHQK